MREDGQSSVTFRAGRRNDALGDFALEHENGGIVPRRPGLDAKPLHEERGRDVVRQVGDDAHRAGRKTLARIEAESVGRHNVEPVRIERGNLLQGGNGPFVALDRDHTGGAERQQSAGESARSGTDFQHGNAGEFSRRARDARGEVQVEQEILSERFPRHETVLADHLAQRRQAVGGAAHDAGRGSALAAIVDSASRAASRSAAIRLVGSALPVPAMSKAVPWSGDVRTNGSPRVTLTA